eukprot:gene13661-13783_t
MAVSLLCKDCNTLLRNVAEAQAHNEATGHANFEESTKPVPTMVCTACGKPCRSDAEKALHTKFTGHTEYVDKVPVQVQEDLLKELLEMGFTEARAARGLHFSGNSSVEGAINWLSEHDMDADIDTPLLVPQAKLRRDREEAETARLREKERIRAGKELLEAKRKEEDGAMRRLVEERKREKEEEARAREALRKKLEEDRRERRRKLGLPEELTDEEKAREEEKARKKAEEEVSKRHVYIKPISVIEKLRGQLVAMKKAGGEEPFKIAASTLLKYMGNIARAPDEDKFRSINLGNAAFQARVAAVPGAVDFLKVVGFEEEGGVLVLSREKVDMEVLNHAGGEINNALTNPFFGVL